MTTITLKVLSSLLSYPEKELKSALKEIRRLTAGDKLLTEDDKSRVMELVDWLDRTDLIRLEETYVLLFDRTRSLSLHMFEHVHGESRERGQAMVDLLQLYQERGFDIQARELPDYIPLFLEFLAHLPSEEALSLLGEVTPILSLLRTRLLERLSPYQAVFQALVNLATAASAPGGCPMPDLFKAGTAAPAGDDEERPVTFGGSPSPCAAASPSFGGSPSPCAAASPSFGGSPSPCAAASPSCGGCPLSGKGPPFKRTQS